ncbi:MAG: alpha/beta hydrolase [Caulobacteraceae bacterium]
MDDAAPLYDPPGAARPKGGSARWFAGAGGARLRGASFPQPGAARGTVVVSPGRTEPIEKYYETIERLRARGFGVVVHDWRGQGLSHRALSDPLLGHARGYGDFIADHAALMAGFVERAPRPWIALGHSMGGCLALLAMARGESRFAGAILSAPMLGVRTGSVPWPVARVLAATMTLAGRGGAPVVASETASNPFAANVLTHDPVRYARNEGIAAAFPALALGVPTWGWLDFALSATALLARGPGVRRIFAPVSIVAAGDDRIVDTAAARRVAERLPHGRFVEIPGAFHEILQETDALQAPFWREFDDLADRIGG